MNKNPKPKHWDEWKKDSRIVWERVVKKGRQEMRERGKGYLKKKKNDLRGNEISGKAMNWGYFHRG